MDSCELAGGLHGTLSHPLRLDAKSILLKWCVRKTLHHTLLTGKSSPGLPHALLPGIRLELRSAWLHGRSSHKCSFLREQEHNKVFSFP